MQQSVNINCHGLSSALLALPGAVITSAFIAMMCFTEARKRARERVKSGQKKTRTNERKKKL